MVESAEIIKHENKISQGKVVYISIVFNCLYVYAYAFAYIFRSRSMITPSVLSYFHVSNGASSSSNASELYYLKTP